MISIITATFNATGTLSNNLASIAAQSLLKETGTREVSRQIEHLLIDGSSTDGTVEKIRSYCADAAGPTHVARYVSEPDNGIYDAMNKGIERACGEAIGILNADDFYTDGQVLEKVARVFEDPTVDSCYGDLQYVDANNTSKIFRNWTAGKFSREAFYWGWMPPHPTFFVRRKIYEKFGRFKLNFGSAADYELMLRFLLKHRISTVYIPEVLVKMRSGGVSNASLKNRIKSNQMDRKAWKENGLKPYPWTTVLKPLRKLGQYFVTK
jgi:glycosyltransferase